MKDQKPQISYRNLVDLFRHFPYLNASAQFFPIYAYLIVMGVISSPWAILMMAPFVFANAAGYAYTNLTDRHNPHFHRNPVAAGMITPVQARWIVLGCVVLSVTTFWFFYRSPSAWISYLIYLFLVLAYSGLGLRLKESLAGPFVAAYGWAAGVLILASEFNTLTSATIISLILGIYLIYVGDEVYRTIIAEANDEQAGHRTFAMRTTSRTQRAVLVISVGSGALCLIWSIYGYLGGQLPGGTSSILTIILLTVIVLAVVVETYFCARNDDYHPSSAFYMLQTSFILYAALILNLPAMFAVLLIWAFLINRRSQLSTEDQNRNWQRPK